MLCDTCTQDYNLSVCHISFFPDRQIASLQKYLVMSVCLLDFEKEVKIIKTPNCIISWGIHFVRKGLVPRNVFELILVTNTVFPVQ